MRDLFFKLQRFGAPVDAAGDGDVPAQGGTQDQQDTGVSASQPAQTTILGSQTEASQGGEQAQDQATSLNSAAICIGFARQASSPATSWMP